MGEMTECPREQKPKDHTQHHTLRECPEVKKSKNTIKTPERINAGPKTNRKMVYCLAVSERPRQKLQPHPVHGFFLLQQSLYSSSGQKKKKVHPYPQPIYTKRKKKKRAVKDTRVKKSIRPNKHPEQSNSAQSMQTYIVSTFLDP